jgi:hypothetical protein
MPKATLTRAVILQALRNALEPLGYVHALWEGGAAAFDRVDAWSDIDLHVDAEDAYIADVVGAVGKALEVLSPVAQKYEVPQPTWHGHKQIFYRLSETSPFLLIDFVFIQHSNPNKFIQPEIHGNPIIHFDKSGVIEFQPLDPETLVSAIKARLTTLRATFELFQTFVLKELNRHHGVEALAFYQGFTLRPLVEALRIKYAPIRYNFQTRYVYYDLPLDVVQELETFFFIADSEALAAKHTRAQAWFYETLGQISVEDVKAQLEVQRE